MFPDVLANEIHDVYVAMDMDVDRTVESLLNGTQQQMRQQQEETSCMESGSSVGGACVRVCVCVHLYLTELQSTKMADKGYGVVDQTVKDSILAKYAAVCEMA